MTTQTNIGLYMTVCSALALACAHPAAAVTTITAGGTDVYGTTTTNYQPTSATNGYIEFITTPSGQINGTFKYMAPLFTDNAPGTTTIETQPSYISSFTGFSVDQASGYGYPDIAPGSEAGLVGYGVGDGSGNIVSFTVGTAGSFTFSALANYSTNDLENPNLLTLTESGSPTVLASDAGSTTDFTPTAYVFNITDATPGETFTLSNDQGYISGLAFDNYSAAPEPSGIAMVGLSTIGLLGLLCKARRRSSAA